MECNMHVIGISTAKGVQLSPAPDTRLGPKDKLVVLRRADVANTLDFGLLQLVDPGEGPVKQGGNARAHGAQLTLAPEGKVEKLLRESVETQKLVLVPVNTYVAKGEMLSWWEFMVRARLHGDLAIGYTKQHSWDPEVSLVINPTPEQKNESMKWVGGDFE